MASLPYLKYTNDFKNAYITSFGGIVSGASAYEGGMCDALNMSNYNFPALCVRLGFAGINMKDENGNEVIVDENILAVGGDDAGGGMLLCGETKLWYYSYDDGFWQEFLTGKEVEGMQKIIFYKRELEIAGYEYTFYIYFMLPSRLVFIKKIRDSDIEHIIEILPSINDKKTWEISNPGAGDTELSTWFGSGASFTSPGILPSIEKPISMDDNESVLSSVSYVFPCPPGIYVTIYKNIPESSGTTTKTTGTGLVRERYLKDENGISEIERVYSTIDNEKIYEYYNSILIASPAGLVPNLRSPDTGANGFYYTCKGTYCVYIDMPEKMIDAFVHDNRLWTWDDENIYASALGIYESFSTDGTDAGGWSAPFILGDKISAAISYMGRPVFFTQNHIITVYGEYPSNYSLSIFSAPGVLYGSSASLCECSGSLYYLSHAGVMRYSGNFPVKISDALKNISIKEGRGVSDAQNYYLYAKYVGAGGEEKSVFFSYNVNYSTWNIIDYMGSSSDYNLGGIKLVSPAMNFISDSEIGFAHIMIFNNNPNAYALLCAPSKEREPLFPGAVVRDGYFGYNDSYIWRARFGEFFLKSPNIKGILQVQLRARLISAPLKNESGLCEAGFKVKICYDGEDASLDGRDILDDTGFETIHTEIVAMDNDNIKYSGEEYRVRNILIPVAPRRFDSFKIEISGTGRWEISSLSFEYMVGSEKV